MLTLQEFTLQNTHIRSESNGQAETIYFNSQGRLIARNAAFVSEQDTLQLKGYSWFYNTLVAGNVDFIWGSSVAAVFEESEIRSLGDSKLPAGTAGDGGYVLQARVVSENDPGYVFLNSRLTHAAGPTGVTINPGSTYLGRAGEDLSKFDNIAFINTAMGSHIADIGWPESSTPKPAVATAKAGWREYGSTDLTGAPLDVTKRHSGSRVLTEVEYLENFCSRAQIFASWNNGEGWDPLPSDASDDHCVVSTEPAETWSGNGLLVGDSSQSSATVASGSISAQTDDSVSFTASDGKFETMAQSFYLVSQQVEGDFVLTAKLKSAGSNYAANQFPVGLMMCECDATAGTTSPLVHVGMHMSGSEWVTQYGHILTAGGGWGKSSGTAVTPGDSLYFKLQRSGQAYYVFVSTDGGVTYTQLGANTFTGLPTSVKVGLFAAPYNDDQPFTFEDIQLTQ